jgi:hypothetical protein
MYPPRCLPVREAGVMVYKAVLPVPWLTLVVGWEMTVLLTIGASLENKEILLYDLSNRPASFDFVTCLATSIALGCKHVRFVYGKWKQKNYSEKQAEERWRSIVEPASSLYGMDYSIGEREGIEVNHLLRASVECYKHTGKIGKINYPCKTGEYVTVTLRNSRNSERNSKDSEWEKFANECDRKVIILRDNEDSSLHLHDRMKLYANAYLNMMVINGPLTLCIHSDAPYVSMRTIGCEKSQSTSPKMITGLTGITPGFQFPWSLPSQRLSYLDDTFENIMHEYHQHEVEQRKAA